MTKTMAWISCWRQLSDRAHPATVASESGSNFITVPQGDNTAMRVDFWYIDRHGRDFYPINPAIRN